MQKKKGKKERELEKQKAEKELSRIEEALMDPGRQPESADDFDRLVLSSPDSSILWLQYMAFHLQATEIEKARAVAERALKTISFRSGLRLFTLSLLTEFATMVHFFLDRRQSMVFQAHLASVATRNGLLIYILWSNHYSNIY